MDKEPHPHVSFNNENKKEDGKQEEEKWEKILDRNENSLNNDLVEEVKYFKYYFINFHKIFFVFIKIRKKFKENAQIKKQQQMIIHDGQSMIYR